jgi:hypothetical protein
LLFNELSLPPLPVILEIPFDILFFPQSTHPSFSSSFGMFGF